MNYLQLFGEQLQKVAINPNITRSTSLVKPMHTEIATQVESYGFQTRSLQNKEYTFVGPYGTKDLDIAIFKNNKLIGAIMFKGIKSEYNKNANNYFENMRGENQLLIDGNLPVYQIILIPTKIKHKNNKKEIVFETPGKNHITNYDNYINSCYKPDKVKIGVYFLDVDYLTYETKYSDIKIHNTEATIEEGIENFIKSLGE